MLAAAAGEADQTANHALASCHGCPSACRGGLEIERHSQSQGRPSCSGEHCRGTNICHSTSFHPVAARCGHDSHEVLAPASTEQCNGKGPVCGQVAFHHIGCWAATWLLRYVARSARHRILAHVGTDQGGKEGKQDKKGKEG